MREGSKTEGKIKFNINKLITAILFGRVFTLYKSTDKVLVSKTSLEGPYLDKGA